ncbi:MAG: glutamine amidotransferase [Gemmataceae bacterium]|nr:glutamine amidotransferase [Gemmataceae bacterium]
MMWAAASLTWDPPWPWSLPRLGGWLLLGTVVALVLLTLWTYWGERRAGWRRIGVVLSLRLIALAIAFWVVLRPSIATEQEDPATPSRLFVVLDASESMNRTDEFGNQSRFDHAKRVLNAPAVQSMLKKLGSDHKVELVYMNGDEELRPYQPSSKAEGKRTDIGKWLHQIRERHSTDANVRGLVLLTDGADNGTAFNSVEKAGLYRGWCPIYAFGLGQAGDVQQKKDIALEKLIVDPSPAPAKTKMNLQVTLQAPGYEGAAIEASVWLEDPAAKSMKQAGPKQKFTLDKTKDVTLTLPTDAPDKDGEIKVAAKVDPLPGEATPINNEISTFVNVTKEGVSILWVEGKRRAFESVFAIRHAISKDPRFRIHYVERFAGLPSDDADPYRLKERHYDVIVLGDISAARFAEGQPDVFAKLREMIENRGSGLVMLGGYESFGGGNWGGSPIADLLATKSEANAQIDEKIRVSPTAEGMKYLLKLSEDPAKNQQIWSKIFAPLEGMANPGTPDPRATIFAMREGGREPVLVGMARGNGRVLAFAGDTTWQAWRRSPEAIPAYERFWKQTMLWLARQEQAGSNLRIRPDSRRLDLGRNSRFGFGVLMTGKGGMELKDPQFKAKVIGPKGEETDVTVLAENRDWRGYFWKANGPGEYKLVVTGKAKESDGTLIEGSDSARFMAFAEDFENLRPAADHEHLRKLAEASGGAFALTEERTLLQRLERIPQTDDGGRKKVTVWPDWRRTPSEGSLRDQFGDLWASTSLPSLVLFAIFIGAEWWLRRRWGLV